MWFGRRFVKRSKELEVALPITSDALIEFTDGCAWLGEPVEVHARLLAWLDKAFRQSIKDSNVELAQLMAQVMPDHELTRAALWRTATKAEADRDLHWFARLERDAGRDGDPARLREQFAQLCEHPPNQAVTVLLIVGPAGSGSKRAAQDLKRLYRQQHGSVELVSFGQFLRAEWERKHTSKATQVQLQELGQQWVRLRPFAFARAVVGQRPISRGVLLVDGVRHKVIVDAMRFMFDFREDPIGVTASDKVIEKRLARREGRSHVREIQEHATEREIPELLRHAKPVLHYDSPSTLHEDELRKAAELAIA
jgi:hypothetical protein